MDTQLVGNHSVCAGDNYGGMSECVAGVKACAEICKRHNYFVQGEMDCLAATQRCWCFLGDTCNIVSNDGTQGFELHRINEGTKFIVKTFIALNLVPKLSDNILIVFLT